MQKTKNQKSIIWAVVLILTGLIILLSSLDVITIKKNIYFFIAIAIIGIIFHITCFINKPKKFSYLVPGGMLIILSALFIACEYSDKLNIDEIWPVIILAAAFGMLEQKVLSKGQQGNWTSIIVVSVIGFFFLIRNNLNFGIAFGSLLIVVGVLIVIRIFKHLPKGAEDKEKNSKIETQPEADEFDQL